MEITNVQSAEVVLVAAAAAVVKQLTLAHLVVVVVAWYGSKARADQGCLATDVLLASQA
jgi:hypothetical protein